MPANDVFIIIKTYFNPQQKRRVLFYFLTVSLLLTKMQCSHEQRSPLIDSRNICVCVCPAQRSDWSSFLLYVPRGLTSNISLLSWWPVSTELQRCLAPVSHQHLCSWRLSSRCALFPTDAFCSIDLTAFTHEAQICGVWKLTGGVFTRFTLKISLKSRPVWRLTQRLELIRRLMNRAQDWAQIRAALLQHV